MAVIPLKSFTGEIPRSVAHLLADNAAQIAVNCDLAYGELKGIKNANTALSLSSVPQSFYTDDGSNFYTWPYQVETAISPVVDDIHQRLYYTTANGADIRVVARKGTSLGVQPPSRAGLTPTGYSVGVPGPGNLIVFGETTPGSGVSNAALHTRLINYDTASAGNQVGAYLWKPVVDGLEMQITFFYEFDGVKYQETDVQIYAENYPTSGAFVALQPSAKYSDPLAPNNYMERIYGRDFHVAIPAKSYVEIEEPVTSTRVLPVGLADITDPVQTQVVEGVAVKKATPSEAIPTLHVTGLVNGSQVWSVYSEGSAFSSNRGTSGVRLFYELSPAQDVIYCGLKYGVEETHAYVYTNVNIFGEESPPSEPVVVDVGYGQTVELYFWTRQVGGSGNTYAPIESTRTYGTNTTSQGSTDYYFVSEGRLVPGLLPAGAGLLNSGEQPTRPEAFGERITSVDYTLPPAGATGICALPNGFFACHRDTDQGTNTPGVGQNEVWFSEPYHPSAWPSKYVISFPWAVVGIKPQGGGLLVTTKGHPYFVYGAHPESMSSTKLPALQAGISKRAMADVGPYVIYASNDGLVAVSNTDVNTELSRRFFTRDIWRALYGANLAYLVLAYHDGFLVGYFTNGAQGFVIRMDEASGTFTRADITATCHFVSVESDLLYLASSNTLFSYGTGVRLAYTWWSKDFVLPAKTCFGVAQIILDNEETGSVTAEVYADGVLKHTISATASGVFRLPSGFVARRWSFKLNGSRTVKEFYLAGSASELTNV